VGTGLGLPNYTWASVGLLSFAKLVEMLKVVRCTMVFTRELSDDLLEAMRPFP
jgi:hypothetical protein